MMEKINFNDIHLGKINLDKKQIFIMTGVIILIGIFIVCRPLSAKIKMMNDEYRRLEQQIETARNILKGHREVKKRGHFLTREEVSLAIEEITKTGRTLNINFLSINPGPIKELTDFSCASLPIQMHLESKYRDVGLFIEALRELENSIVSVKELEISRDEKILPLVKSSLELEMYLQRGTGGQE